MDFTAIEQSLVDLRNLLTEEQSTIVKAVQEPGGSLVFKPQRKLLLSALRESMNVLTDYRKHR